ncbi:MAG: hypothetical protein ACREQM_09185, partial [Candidatus Dormibacteraceae bacterium]
VERAAKVAEQSPQLLDNVRAGKVKLAEAEHLARGNPKDDKPARTDEGPKYQFLFAARSAREILHCHMNTMATGAIQASPAKRRDAVETFKRLRSWVDELLTELETS